MSKILNYPFKYQDVQHTISRKGGTGWLCEQVCWKVLEVLLQDSRYNLLCCVLRLKQLRESETYGFHYG